MHCTGCTALGALGGLDTEPIEDLAQVAGCSQVCGCDDPVQETPQNDLIV